MFEEIQSVDWQKLSHSHGSAIDVPQRLKALVGTAEGERSDALAYFWDFMLHQGSRYEASPYVVRFIFEALEDENCVIQRELIDLLLALGVGYGESFLSFGYDLQVEEQRFEQHCWNSLFGYDEARSAYYEVHQRASGFARFLRAEYDPETRLSAGFALAHFAQPLSALQGEVAEYIKTERDEAQLQSLILCFGMLGRFADAQPDIRILLPHLDGACSQTIRVAAAIAMTTILNSQVPDLAVNTLLVALTEGWTLKPIRDWQWWNEGDLLGYAALVLRFVGKDRRDEIARVLCAALTKMEACTFALPQTLIDLLFPDSIPPAGWQVTEFDEVQWTSLRILLRTKHWRDWMISSRFLPPGLTGDAYRSALQKFLSDVLEDGSSLETKFSGRAGNVSSWDLKKHWP